MDFNWKAQYVGLDTSHELEVVFKCTNGMTPSRWRDSVYQYDGKMPPHIQRVVDSIAPKLTEWEKNKGYCSLNVSVKDLSKQLDIPNHELELYISVIHPKGFDKHIDQLRISESKKIMTQNPSLSTSDVAKMVGYSGLFTFSQAFYRLLKILPSEWKQSRGLESNLQQNEFFPFDNEPIIEWIEKKGYCKPRLTIKDVAKQVGFTESSLSKYIRRSENLSFTEWISKLRYEEANRIFLKKPWLSYAQIAEQIGYSRRMSFARWYKLQTELNLEKQNE